ncbi:LOW QUALITY PROTEIN: regulator of G-protein signaling 13-like [Ctenodactylus gundi]
MSKWCWICKICRNESKRPPSNLNYYPNTLKAMMQHCQINGPVVYAAYLKTHSDKNIKFWRACETYKKIASQQTRISKAKKLYRFHSI